MRCFRCGFDDLSVVEHSPPELSPAHKSMGACLSAALDRLTDSERARQEAEARTAALREFVDESITFAHHAASCAYIECDGGPELYPCDCGTAEHLADRKRLLSMTSDSDVLRQAEARAREEERERVATFVERCPKNWSSRHVAEAIRARVKQEGR